MKWFQHKSDSHTNPKIRQIIRKYGLEGVGLWWICCELVAKDGVNYSVKKEKDWLITLTELGKTGQEEVKKMLDFFAEINAIDRRALKRGILRVKQMSEYSDDYSKRVRRVSEQTTDNVRQDKITLHNTTKEEIKDFSFKDYKRPYFNGIQMRKKGNKWYCIPNGGGEWLEFVGNEKDIIYK